MQQIEPTEDLKQSNNTTSPTQAHPASNNHIIPSLEDFEAETRKGFGWKLSSLRRVAGSNLNAVENEVLRRRNLLWMMMLVVVGYIAIILPILAIAGLIKAVNFWGALGGLIVILLAFALSLVNRLKTASYIFLGGVELTLILTSLDNAGMRLALLSFNYYAITGCIVLGGLLIDKFAPFIFTITGIIGFSLVYWSYSANNTVDSALLIQIVTLGGILHFVMAIMSWGSARTINRAVEQLSLQNQELMKANAQLAQNLNRDLVIGDTIGALSGDLSQISHDQSDRAQSQAKSVTIVTSTLEELGATARQIADVAESVVIATEQALHTAEAGGQSVGLSIDSIGTLITQVEDISAIASELGKQSKRISEIVETITDLAEETNLLALNATIEAAGAGEYGRRFAVVASEVQTLANRSRAASRDVQSILNQIRTSIESTLLATEGGLQEARRMSEVASQAGEAIEQIIETVESTTYLARQINLTTRQQRSATDQAVEMVRQVAGDAREAASRAQQLLEVSDRLSQTASHLRRD